MPVDTAVDVDAVKTHRIPSMQVNPAAAPNRTDVEGQMMFKGSDISFVPVDPSSGSARASGSLDDVGKDHVPSTLEFKDLRYEVDMGKGKKKTTKHILKGVSGYVEAGRVLAIMGASGAGKTTLLNLLAGTLSAAGNGRTSGSVLVNGAKRDFASFRTLSSYLMQQDNFFAEMTVHETISFAAKLRLPGNMSLEEKLKRVDEIIMELGLDKVRDSYVGNELVRGVSGGERKRVSIGTEMVMDPSLIFLDEPTTGLDSFNAMNVMASMRDLARRNRTIVTTIHMPRSSIFQMFDKLLLLSEGSTMYFGDAAAATTYFEGLGFPCPRSFNPADFFLDLISIDRRTKAAAETSGNRIEYLAEAWTSHEKEAGPPSLTYPGATGKSGDVQKGKYAQSWWTQFAALSGRAYKVMMREKASNIARLAQTIVFALLLGVIWLQEGKMPFGSGAIQSVAGGLFFITINMAFQSMFGIIFLFPTERVVVLKERSSRTYHVSAYFLSKTVSEFPRTCFISLLFSSVAYWMVFFRPTFANFLVFWIVSILISMSAEGLAYVVSALAKDPQMAGAIAPVFIVTSMLFGGFFIGVNQIPVWLSWLGYLSFIKYGFAAVMQNEFGNRELTYDGCTGFCPPNGDAILEFYDADEMPMWLNIVILAVFAMVMRILAYLILLRGGPKFDKSI